MLVFFINHSFLVLSFRLKLRSHFIHLCDKTIIIQNIILHNSILIHLKWFHIDLISAYHIFGDYIWIKLLMSDKLNFTWQINSLFQNWRINLSLLSYLGLNLSSNILSYLFVFLITPKFILWRQIFILRIQIPHYFVILIRIEFGFAQNSFLSDS